MHACPLPPLATEACRALAGAGIRAWLAGEPLWRLERGLPGRPPRILCEAPPGCLLAALERAVPTAARARVLSWPWSGGVFDLVPLRADELELELAAQLARPFAIALDPWRRERLAPFDGAEDVLRPTPNAERFAEARPLRALRCARTAAEAGLEWDADFARALAAAAPALGQLPALAIRSELLGLLSADAPAVGLALLHAAGLEACIAPEVGADGRAAVGRVEAPESLRLPLRLAVWLEGAPAEALLARLRVPRGLAAQVLVLRSLHPIDECLDPARAAGVRRAVERAGAEALGALCRVRESDPACDAGRAERLRALRHQLAEVVASRARRESLGKLGIDGAEVMRLLGIGPGPRVGEALRRLSDWVAEAPERNQPQLLRAQLLAWWQAEAS